LCRCPAPISGTRIARNTVSGWRARFQYADAVGSRQPAEAGHAGLPDRSVKRAGRAAAQSRRSRRAAEGNPVLQSHAGGDRSVQTGPEAPHRLRQSDDRRITCREKNHPVRGGLGFNDARILRRSRSAECSMSAFPSTADLPQRSGHVSFVPLAEVALIRSLVVTGSTSMRRSFGQPGSPQSFFVSREVFGMSIRSQHVFEIGNTQRGIQ
jgi:hypothetical protein